MEMLEENNMWHSYAGKFTHRIEHTVNPQNSGALFNGKELETLLNLPCVQEEPGEEEILLVIDTKTPAPRFRTRPNFCNANPRFLVGILSCIAKSPKKFAVVVK